MVRWGEFLEQAGDVGAGVRERVKRHDLVALGTVKTDGSPRISMCEAYAVDGDLMLGMMWQSKKALDLLRDPRLFVHTVVSDKSGGEGEAKLIGRAVDVPEPARRQAYGDVLEEQIDWRPDEPFHLFAFDLERAWLIRYEGDDQRIERWP